MPAAIKSVSRFLLDSSQETAWFLVLTTYSKGYRHLISGSLALVSLFRT